MHTHTGCRDTVAGVGRMGYFQSSFGAMHSSILRNEELPNVRYSLLGMYSYTDETITDWLIVPILYYTGQKSQILLLTWYFRSPAERAEFH